ncbi:MAG: hypothetical protein QXO82_00840 [Candidatus Methanomethylicia archaeon]
MEEAIEGVLKALLVELSSSLVKSMVNVMGEMPKEMDVNSQFSTVMRQTFKCGFTVFLSDIKALLERLEATGDFVIEDLQFNMFENKHFLQFESTGWNRENLIDQFALWIDGRSAYMTAFFHPEYHDNLNVKWILKNIHEIAEKLEETFSQDEELHIPGEVEIEVVDEEFEQSINININVEDIEDLPTIKQLTETIWKTINKTKKKRGKI